MAFGASPVRGIRGSRYRNLVGRIVVGVDGSEGGQAALRFALEEARLRGAALHVVHAWKLPLYEGVPGAFVLAGPLEPTPPLDEVRQALQDAAERVVEDALRDVAGDGAADLEVHREVVEAAPARALIAFAEGADLLVVGSRGRGGFLGLRLGSVSSQCTHHAPCPVVIVPHTR